MSNSDPKPIIVLVDDIQIGERRPADPKKVQRHSESIQEIGLLHPVGLTPNKRLIHGLHRLEACKALGWKKIPAVIHDLDDLHAELAEIDENLMRSNLTALEESEALDRRQQIYDTLHPGAKRGGDRKSRAAKSNGQNGHSKSFAEDTAEKTGKSARTIRRYVGIARNICKDLRKQLKGHPVEDKQAELEKLGRLPEADQRLVAERITAGAKSVAEAIRDIEGCWSPEMRAIVIDKQALRDLGKTQDYDMAARDAELKRLAELPADEQRVVAEMVTNDEAESVFEAIDAIAAPEASDEAATATPEPTTENDGHTDIPTEAAGPSGSTPEDDGSDAVDPVTVYRNYLRDLPEKIRFLDEHFDEVVGYGLDPSEAARVLEQAVDFFERVLDAESTLAEEPAETDVASCGA